MIKSIVQIILFLTISVLTIFAINQYVGSWYIYLFFTITSNVLLYFGFRKNAIFFDTFIGIFLWLGFWFKTTIVLIFFNSRFVEKVGFFSGSKLEFDNALFIASMGFLALIFASLLREKFIFRYSNTEYENSSLFYFYTVHRNKILTMYIVLFITVAVTNAWFSIYQRGELSNVNISFIIAGTYKWLLLFGLSSIAALILKYEFSLNRKGVYLVPILTLVEATVTNISLLSRGMMLNASALGLGMIKFTRNNKFKIKIKYWFLLIFTFVILFLVSVIGGNKLREHYQNPIKSVILNTTNTEVHKSDSNINLTAKRIAGLFVNRSVGMEGLLAISSVPNKNWSLLIRAFKEKYDENKTSFYDALIKSGYKNSINSNRHLMSLPGFIAFFYYPGSAIFLFCALFILGILASLIEIAAYKLGKNNQILSALIAQVVAYRFIHFGYVPGQSYLLFGTIFLNLFIIFGLDKVLSIWYKQEKKDEA